MSNVQVGVRLRPSKKMPAPGADRYEEKYASAIKEQYKEGGEYQLAVRMPEDAPHPVVQIVLDNATGEMVEYSFPFCFWTHDKTQLFADQPYVYERIGKPLLDSIYQGFNACLFAYGQTGSGKTYTMMGIDHKDIIADKIPEDVVLTNNGIIPRIFRNLAAGMIEPGVKMTVEMSFIEIYNEKLNDLLVDRKQPMDIAINHDAKGRAIFNNKKVPDKDSPNRRCSYTVADLKALEEFYRVGNTRRAVAATQMNASSSRSHSLVILDVTRKAPGQKQTTGQLFLVDLAGSERLSKTGASEQTMIEGTFINLSLTVLGRVIDDVANGRKSSAFRESLLALCLKNAIGGNCLTVVFGALGPSSHNAPETKNTLDFCQRASRIKCKAVQDTQQVSGGAGALAELKKDNEILMQERDNLKKMLADLQSRPQGGGSGGASEAQLAELDELRRQLEDKEAQSDVAARKLQTAALFEDLSDDEIAARMKAESEAQLQRMLDDMQRDGITTDTSIALLVNLAQDNSQDGVVRYGLPFRKSTTLGSGNDNSIQIQAYRVRKHHCTIENNENNTELYITPVKGAETRVNGEEITGRTRLQQNDRLCFGTDMMFYVDTRQPTEGGTPSWNQAMKEVTKGRGLLQEDKAAEEAKAALAKREAEIVAMQANLAEMQLEQRRAEEERIKSLEEKVKRDRQKVDEDVLNGQMLLEMIGLASLATDLCNDLNVQPGLHLEATMQTIPTEKGDKRSEVMAVLSVTGVTEKFMIPKSAVNDLVAYLQEERVKLEDGADFKPEPWTFRLPGQLAGLAILGVRNLLFLCDVGVDDDDDGETEPKILPAELIDQGSATSHKGGVVFAALKINAPIEPRDEQDFLAEEISQVVGAWQRLRDRKVKVSVTAKVTQCQSLPTYASKGQYIAFNVFGDGAMTTVNKDRTTKPVFNFEKKFDFAVTDQLIDWLATGTVIMKLFYTPEPLKIAACGRFAAPAEVAVRPMTTIGQSAPISPAAPAKSAGADPQIAELQKQLEEERQKAKTAAAAAAAKADAEAKVVALQKELEAERQKAKSAPVVAVVPAAQRTQSVTDVAALKAELATIKKELETTKAVTTKDHDTQAAEVAKLHKQLEEERARTEAASKILPPDSAQAELIKVQRQLEEERVKSHTELEQEREKAKAAATAQSELEKVRSELKASQDELSKSKKQVTELQATGGKSAACTLL
eukprot:TRINITY_DN5823_c0_g1_i1.p1 TRINITY_DN5823_c0_g1~~TRINITY_DN5823_c0_g1_i1.p1  ORF type:complete len:1205 (-),score=368.62 TRINITY_DN5823_c0_g1_i1:2085-5699(-)